MTALSAAVLLLAVTALRAEVKRIVVIKSDGLPGYLVQELATGGKLPWIRHVFFEGGAQVANFYVRGLSVSAPSWAVIETGRDPVIRGNVEFDRYSLHAYDYLNFFPFYFRNAFSKQVDTTEVEVLDGVGARLLTDAFREEECYRGYQLLQRGVNWTTLAGGLKRGLNPRSVRNLVDEWIVGFQIHDSLNEQVEQELIRKLRDPRVRYLDLFHAEFDHVAHLTHDPRVLLRVMQDLDALVGRLWSAIERSPMAEETALILVSDHGINNDANVFGQGWNLVDGLRSAVGGGHHVITNRHPRSDYKVRGLNPFVSEVINESGDSFYLKGEASAYPTAVVDLDGNERASVYLRNSDWNALQILLQQLQRTDLPDSIRRATIQALNELAAKHRGGWSRIGGLTLPELDRLEQTAASAEKSLNANKKTSVEIKREIARVLRIQSQLHEYREYLTAVSKMGVGQAIPKRALGDANSIYQLQNYVTGLAEGGLALDENGSLDWARSFRRVDYFAYFSGVRVRNVPQVAVGAQPVDFVATRVSREALARVLPAHLAPDSDGVWLYKDAEHQALIVRKNDRLRYLPIRGLVETERGEVQFSDANWGPGLPLDMREEEGAEWRSDREWLRLMHDRPYSNAVVGLATFFASPISTPAASDALSDFERRERQSVEPDLLILANHHWNFNVRSFNPGGNHGSFFPVSTHATLLLAGGTRTGLPRGLRISEPYDALSFAPTVLKLFGKSEYGQLPGPVIEELFRTQSSSDLHTSPRQ